MNHQKEDQTVKNTALNKTEIVELISRRTGIRVLDVNRVFTELLDLTTEELAAGREVALSGIGVLSPVRHAARKSHNPRTLEPVTIPERTRVQLRMSKVLRRALGEEVPEYARSQD